MGFEESLIPDLTGLEGLVTRFILGVLAAVFNLIAGIFTDLANSVNA